MVWLIIIFVIILLLWFFVFRKQKTFKFDTIVSINGSVGSGKTSTSVYLAKKYINYANRLYFRKKRFYDIFKKGKYPQYFEQPLLYSNIPIFQNKKKGILYRYYRPLTLDIIRRRKRPHYHSILYQSEVSLIATSQDYKDLDLSQDLQLQLKLIRHELRGSYRGLFGKSYPNLIIETQSKNDTHYAYDRNISQCLYLFKSLNLPFFRVVWCRELLLVDSVINEFEDDVKETKSIRWFLIPKSIFNKFDSYSYSILSDNLPVQSYKGLKFSVINKRFEIATFHDWKEINRSNEIYKKELNEIELQKKVV